VSNVTREQLERKMREMQSALRAMPKIEELENAANVLRQHPESPEDHSITLRVHFTPTPPEDEDEDAPRRKAPKPFEAVIHPVGEETAKRVAEVLFEEAQRLRRGLPEIEE
jgi:5-formyltetrahydrofolate cyclo-ligase